MNETIVLPKETSKALADLTGEPRTSIALTIVMRDYARHKLAELGAEIHRYEEKYRMPFEQYKREWESRDRAEDYTYEAESDFLEWEALVTRYKRVSENYAWLP